MSTQFTNRQWRLPNNENKDKQSNYSMDFDGSNQYINLGNSTQVQPVKEMSISAWINASSLATYRGIVSCTYQGSSYDGFALRLDDTSSNKIQFVVNSLTQIKSTSTITTGQWYHLVATYDGANIKLYFNGSLESSTSLTGNIDYSDGSRNTIIGSLYTNAFEFTGKIDAVSIYNYALSSSQVTTLYGSSSTGIGNPMAISGGGKPVAYYPLGDQDAFNGANYLVPNSSLKDYVFGFNGSNGYVDYGYTALTAISGGSSTLTTSMTISIWFKLNNATSEKGLIYFGDLNNNYGGFTIRHYASKFNFLRGSSHIITGGYSFTDTTSWHNMTLVYDPTNASNCYLYIDGSDTGVTFNASVGDINFLNSNLSQRSLIIGTYYNTSYIFNGEISNVQTFNTALSSTDAETIYNNGSPIKTLANIPQNSNLQGWWKLDASDTYDGTNWTIEDHAGSNDGTSSGMTQANLVQSDLSFTSGYSPYALDFDSASGDEIDIPTITLANDFTISAWVTNTVSGSGNDQLLSASSGFFVFSTAVRNGGATAGKMTYYNGSSFIAFTDVIRDDNWHYVSLTYNSSTTTLTGYTDGNQTYSATYDAGTNNQINKIGDNLYSHNWLGKISNLSIWNAALTSAQISEIYSEGIPQNLLNHSAVSSLVSWWQLGSNSSFNSSLNQWTCIDEKGTNTGESSQTFNEDAIVDGVGSYANGLSSGMGGDEVIGSAPFSDANSLSINMDVLDRVEDTPS